MTSTRRQFLVGSAFAGAGLSLRPAPRWLSAKPKTTNGQILVVIQCRGGYDGLGLIVPAGHPNYVLGRPNLAIPQASCLPLAAGRPYFWAPAMQQFKDLFDRGDLAIVHNVGYPSPNLSHFESEKKWAAADPSASVLQSGWLARWLDAFTGTATLPAIDIESRLNDAFSGQRVPVMTSLSAFGFESDTGTGLDRLLELAMIQQNAQVLRPTADPSLAYVAAATDDAYAATQLIQQAAATYVPGVVYPTSTLSSRLQLAASLITGNLGAETYVLDTGGFDLHANAAIAASPGTGNLANLATNLGACVKAFLDDLIAHAMGQQVVVLVFSEFGRRFWENGSIGTDHGHGNFALLAGQPVNGGEYGTFPDMNAATHSQYYAPFNGLSTDFRSLYGTILERWLGVSHATVLGGSYPLLGAL